MRGAALRGARSQTPLRAGEDGSLGMCTGHCRKDKGDWTLLQSVPIESEEEEALANKAWEVFKTEYPKPAKTGMFIDTPVAKEDVKYRWRRLRNTFRITSEECLGMLGETALPLVIDSDHVQATFEAMVEGSSYDRALEVVRKNPSILTASTKIGDKMEQAEAAAAVRQLTRPLEKFIQSLR